MGAIRDIQDLKSHLEVSTGAGSYYNLRTPLQRRKNRVQLGRSTLMSDYQSPEFLTDVGNHSYTFDELSYHDKMKVKALEGLDKLASSLNAISNIKAIEFQLNHLNEMSDGFEAQLT